MNDSKHAKPQLIFIAGSNGSGKSTLWKVAEFGEYIPFLNVDEKFKELQSANPDASFKEASDWRNAEMTRLIRNRESFVAETVFDQGKLGYIKAAKKNGFETTVHFIALESADLAVERVRQRVEKGGHDIPEDTVRRKWQESLEVANLAVERVDEMDFYDNSGELPELAAVFRAGKVVELSKSFPSWLMKMPYVKKAIEDFQQKPPDTPNQAATLPSDDESSEPTQEQNASASNSHKAFAIGHCSRLNVEITSSQHPMHLKGKVGALLIAGRENVMARLMHEVRQAFTAKLNGFGIDLVSRLTARRAASKAQSIDLSHPKLPSAI